MDVLNTSLLEKDLYGDEGCKLSVYKDHLGFWTIGIGTLVDDRKGGGITLDEAYYLLRNRLKAKFDDMDKQMPWWRGHPECVQRALANMAYQMGVDGLLEFKNSLALLKARQYNESADNFLKSLWAKQTPERAKRVTDLIRQAAKGA